MGVVYVPRARVVRRTYNRIDSVENEVRCEVRAENSHHTLMRQLGFHHSQAQETGRAVTKNMKG